MSQKRLALKQVAGWIFCNRSVKSSAVNYIQKRIWLAWSKFRFLRLPVEKRVRLEVTTDGRHITFLLVSLYEAGYGVQVFGSQFVFRELMLLRKTAPIPFLYGGKQRECGISISDEKHSPLATRHSSLILLDYDYFSGLNKGWVSHGGTANTEVGEDRGKNESRENFNHGLHNRAPGKARDGATEGRGSGNERVKYTRIEAEQTGLRLASQASASEPDALTSKLARAPVSESLIRSADGPTSPPATSHSLPATAPEALRMPYFMQPKALHAGYHKFEFKNLESRRRIRLGFYGTHNPLYYTQHFRFPILPRTQILERFIEKFRNDFHSVTADSCDHLEVKIAVSLDDGRGDLGAKKFLPQEKFFSVLEDTDFMLCPPGWCMPQAHNIVESMSRGAIPILNYPNYMVPQLVNGINCLAFSTLDEMELRVREALEMPQSQVQQMRLNAVKYYRDNWKPGNWWAHLLENSKGGVTVLVNNEEESVGIMEPDFLVAAADYIAKHLFK